MKVFVVRQFFEDNHDTSYTGVYSDFWKAVAGAKAEQEENWDDCGLEACPTFPGEIEENPEIWLEVTFEGKPQGIYFTIDRLEIDA